MNNFLKHFRFVNYFKDQDFLEMLGLSFLVALSGLIEDTVKIVLPYLFAAYLTIFFVAFLIVTNTIFWVIGGSVIIYIVVNTIILLNAALDGEV